MTLEESILEQMTISPFFNSDIDIEVLMREYEIPPLSGVNLQRIMSNCNGIFDQTYFDWKDSREPDINIFFSQKARELEKRGDIEHAKLLKKLLADRLAEENNLYLRELEMENLRDKIIIFCEDKTSLVHKIDWPQEKGDIQKLLETFGWVKISCSRYKNPMVRIRKPKIFAKRRKIKNGIFYYNPFYDMWATIGESTLYID